MVLPVLLKYWTKDPFQDLSIKVLLSLLSLTSLSTTEKSNKYDIPINFSDLLGALFYLKAMIFLVLIFSRADFMWA
jgi:hypothetical protein